MGLKRDQKRIIDKQMRNENKEVKEGYIDSSERNIYLWIKNLTKFTIQFCKTFILYFIILEFGMWFIISSYYELSSTVFISTDTV